MAIKAHLLLLKLRQNKGWRNVHKIRQSAYLYLKERTLQDTILHSNVAQQHQIPNQLQ